MNIDDLDMGAPYDWRRPGLLWTDWWHLRQSNTNGSHYRAAGSLMIRVTTSSGKAAESSRCFPYRPRE